MAIIKNAKNINIVVKDSYTSISKVSYEESEEVIVEALKENLEFSSQKKVVKQGFGNESEKENLEVKINTPDNNSSNGGPIITITNKEVGWGHIKLIGADNRRNSGSFITIGVPLYKMIVTHDTDKNFKYESLVSRDSWIVKNVKDRTAEVCNAAFEPKDNNEYEGVYIDVYPHHNDTAAYKLEQNDSDVLKSEERFNDRLEKVTSAKSIMIHVGGYYKNEKDPTYGDKERIRAGGSLGCFGIINKENSIKNTSDKETQDIIEKIRKKSDEDAFFGYSTVKIIIEKRTNVKRVKTVTLPI